MQTTFSDLPRRLLSDMSQDFFENRIMSHLWITAEPLKPSLPRREVQFQVFDRNAMIDRENLEYLDLGQEDRQERVEPLHATTTYNRAD